jgi:DNA-binding response OmpR family regulator
MARVLIIDDERLVRELLRDLLARQGHQVVMAETGPRGLELFIDHKPDVTLLDVNLPQANGIEVLKKIRASNPTAPVIMLTGDERDHLEGLARKLGVTDFVRKSISPQALMATVAGVTQQPSSGPSQQRARGTGHSILIVDDEVLLCSAIQDVLSRLGYRVRTAFNGVQALTQIDHEPPDMVLVDMYMPGMNGIQLIRELRARHYAGGIIVLTGSKDEKMLQEALDLGSVDVIGKPVDLDRLALAIEVALTLSEPKPA